MFLGLSQDIAEIKWSISISYLKISAWRIKKAVCEFYLCLLLHFYVYKKWDFFA